MSSFSLPGSEFTSNRSFQQKPHTPKLDHFPVTMSYAFVQQGQKGYPGPVGPVGRVGPPGVPGPRGDIGPAGDMGMKGHSGPKGKLGEPVCTTNLPHLFPKLHICKSM